MIDYFNDYFELIRDETESVDHLQLVSISKMIQSTINNGGKVIIVGNGGSAAIASHAAIDFTKAANIRAVTFNESSLLTCLSNDYGYERWVEKAIGYYANDNDMVILISSSGQSDNIVNGAQKARDIGLPLITLSGFLSNNPLRQMGDINLWVDSSKYNIIETVHQIWILSIVDFLIENND